MTISRTTSKRKAITSADRLIREIGLKVFLVGEESKELPVTKLYNKSIWEPPSTSREIDRRTSAFEAEIKRLFSPKRKITPNLSSMQLKLLDRLTKNDKIVYTNSDNGFGIAAVELYKYTQGGLKHLLDFSTYKIISTSVMK